MRRDRPNEQLKLGAFFHPTVNKSVGLTGYLLQTTNQFGAGLFFGTDQTGSVVIEYTP